MTDDLKAAFAAQAEICGRMGSPWMARALPLMLNAALTAPDVSDVLSQYPVERLAPSADAPALRLAAGFHNLVLSGNALGSVYPPQTLDDEALFDALCRAAQTNSATLIRFLQTSPQTNEVRRSAILIAVGNWLTARVGKMMILSELGCSAGLNLHWDFYRMDAAGISFGPRKSPVHLTPDWRGTAPTQCPAYVHGAQGIDLSPPQITSDAGRMGLLSYLWPDQPERMDLTRAALDVAAQPDTEGMVSQGDAIEWLPTRLKHQAPYLHLIYSTVAWQYLPQDAQNRGEAMIAAHGATATDDSPLAWFQMESDGSMDSAALTLRLWPGDIRVNMGRADFHGRWVDWQAPAP